MKKPNVLFLMTDQQRFDTIAALGASHLSTPNLDRLVRRGLSFPRAYATCPVCMASRYTIMTGCEPPRTRYFGNGASPPGPTQADTVEGRCGPYLGKAMRARGYRTFGVGKFHTTPRDEDLGFDVHLHTEEIWGGPGDRQRDAYAAFLREKHPAFAWIEQLHGERSEMYYMPQVSPLPAELTVEAFVADRAVELIAPGSAGGAADDPWFGFVSFIGPHPPFAPPLPYNRMYDPRNSPEPVCGDPAVDHLDDYLPYMNYMTWSDTVDPVRTAVLRARYYGEISYIDACIGRILDAVERRPDADNTLICFYSDHGDHLGDHRAWQKESYFDASCRVPFLLSWPARLPRDARRDDLVCLADLFGIATGAAGACEARDGVDVLGAIDGRAARRGQLLGLYGPPGSERFKLMLIDGDWKYIYLANGGCEQLFNLRDDPHEIRQRLHEEPARAARMRRAAAERVRASRGMEPALDGDDLRARPFELLPRNRLLQMDASSGVKTYSHNPRA
jgi:choline-sulfatase